MATKLKAKLKAASMAVGIVTHLKKAIVEKGEQIRKLKEENASTADLASNVSELIAMKIKLAKLSGETITTGQTPTRNPSFDPC